MPGRPGNDEDDLNRPAGAGVAVAGAPLAAAQPRASRARPCGRARLLPRRTFTVEVWVDGEHVVATQVVHLETQEAEAWYGWNSAHLIEFLEAGVGVPDPGAGQSGLDQRPGVREREGAPPVPEAVAERTVTTDRKIDATGAGGRSLARPVLVVHRFGLLRSAGLVTAGDEACGRLRLDPADLDLPAGSGAVADIELMARPQVGRAEVIARRAVALDGQPVDILLRGPLPRREPPFALMATVRVLVGQPGGSPREGIGAATLEVVRTPIAREYRAGDAGSGRERQPAVDGAGQRDQTG